MRMRTVTATMVQTVAGTIARGVTMSVFAVAIVTMWLSNWRMDGIRRWWRKWITPWFSWHAWQWASLNLPGFLLSDLFLTGGVRFRTVLISNRFARFVF